ncbi:hypothetical protein [Alteromonas facilis]|uniref:hypothetical protein n=1 Tax=Alteromonas facilis TaxID=2048004 RepID=UPI000C281240|nr:hypothetical protein [Alteromonas facilis]
MKKCLQATFLLSLCVCANAHAGIKGDREAAAEWLVEQTSGLFSLSFNKQKIQFEGCKQKAYDLTLTSDISDGFSIDFSIGYGKAKNSWGVFSQQVIEQDYQFMPRWQFADWRIGLGVKVQSTHQLRASHGPAIELPLSKQWAIEADLPAFSEDHHFRVALVREDWRYTETQDVAVATFNHNNAITLNYSMRF